MSRWGRSLASWVARLRERGEPDGLQAARALERAAIRLRASTWPDDLLRVLARLREHGGRAYLVGGTVRDALLGRAGVPLYDVATSVMPDVVQSLFPRVE